MVQLDERRHMSQTEYSMRTMRHGPSANSVLCSMRSDGAIFSPAGRCLGSLTGTSKLNPPPWCKEYIFLANGTDRSEDAPRTS